MMYEFQTWSLLHMDDDPLKDLAGIYVGFTPHPVTVTSRIITFLVGDPYKPSLSAVAGWRVDLRYKQVPSRGYEPFTH